VVRFGDPVTCARLQWCYGGVTVISQWVSVVFQWCYSGVTVVLQWCYSGVRVVLQWCYSGLKVMVCFRDLMTCAYLKPFGVHCYHIVVTLFLLCSYTVITILLHCRRARTYGVCSSLEITFMVFESNGYGVIKYELNYHLCV
jgi:hypothetical protein